MSYPLPPWVDFPSTLTPISAANLLQGNAAINGLDGRVTTLEGTTPTTGPQGPPGLVWRGAYNNATTYATNDAVSYGTSSFIATAGVIGVPPGNPAAPTAPWQALAIGSLPEPGPTWNALLGWTYDPMLISTNSAVTNGVLLGSLVFLQPGTITNLLVEVTAAAVGSTTGENLAALYSASGALVAQTADQSTAWASTGVLVMPLTVPYTATIGFYYVAILGNATTPAHMACASTAGHFNNGTPTAHPRAWGVGSGLTALFTPVISPAPTNVSLWCGVS